MKRQTLAMILVSIVLLLLLIPISIAVMILLDISDISKLFPYSVSSLIITGIGIVLSALIVGFLAKIAALKIYKEEKSAKVAFLAVFFIAVLISAYSINIPRIGPSPQKVIYYTLYENEVYVNPYFGKISLPFEEKDWTKEHGLRPSGYLKREEGIVNGSSGFVFQNITGVYIGIFVYPNSQESPKCENALQDLEERLKNRGWQEVEVPPEALEKRNFIGRLINAKMLQQGSKAVYLECSDVMAYGRLIILYGEKKEVIELASILS
ncbi:MULTISPECIES: hypothetical protein [Thermococcus]|uniref:Uncharacterized protein n=2 Tax=Thermococcus sibiricus TaxID=172049 RepID=C6A3C5_THESM|nr:MULTISPECIES: hypothetical protein [Thermococcus]KUK29080.1 MAG: Uncharacterized protein XD61_0404 [Thermococcus sp. 40_45]HII68171.1 hypothetical protein [Thermococcaceae archaeon]ACS90120.1 hypothetical protein TSIB_1064 [Thermococcus sibiricus MM 739]KUK18673.1 MAG: Uncharacterized protein XD54_0058 [Thermococcus sibiricus]MBC7094958.1 hypothetical protein [Thermococcus sp.]